MEDMGTPRPEETMKSIHEVRVFPWKASSWPLRLVTVTSTGTGSPARKLVLPRRSCTVTWAWARPMIRAGAARYFQMHPFLMRLKTYRGEGGASIQRIPESDRIGDRLRGNGSVARPGQRDQVVGAGAGAALRRKLKRRPLSTSTKSIRCWFARRILSRVWKSFAKKPSTALRTS